MSGKSNFPDLEALLSAIVSTIYSLRPHSEVEKRTDAYLVGGKHFGLKLRNGEKLELKTLVNTSDLGVEQYVKVKFGKKGIKHYEDEILEELRRHGHHQDQLNRSILHHSVLIEVGKARTNTVIGNVVVEVADLELIAPCNAPKHWCSIAVESDNLVDIQSFVASNGLIRRILHDINAFNHKADAIPDHHIAYPLIGGYPAWIEYISKECDRSMGRESFASVLQTLFH